MNRLLFLILIVDFHCMILVNGQCTISKGKDVAEEVVEELNAVSNRLLENLQYMRTRDAIILKKIEEHEQRLQAMDQTLSSRLQSRNESAVNTMETSLTTNGNLSTIVELNEKVKAVGDRLNGNIQYVVSQGECDSRSEVCDCSEIKELGSRRSGMYRLNVLHQQKRHYFFAYCDMTTRNGSWTVFQRRKDGRENFYRGWRDYENGFGNPEEEFWLGNEFLYLLTSKRSYRLRIDMEDVHNVKRFTEYSTFRIGSSADKYQLTARGYSGAAADGLRLDTGKKFTTKDSDNCEWAGNTAAGSEGAWWYSSTARLSHLNGLYPDGLIWRDWFGKDYSKNYSLKTAEMKISSDF